MPTPTPRPVVLITGCSSGIGESLALAFAARNFTVVATARQTSALAHLTKRHDNIIPLPLELGNLASLDSFRDAVLARTGGRLDVLVNNAGTHYAATALELDIAEAEKVFAVNVLAVMRLCQLFLPYLCEAPRGRIVQIGSVTRDVPVAWQCVYNASKAALSQYTKTLRLEVQPFGVEVVEVVTGFVRSNLLHHGLDAPKDSPYLAIKKDIERIKFEGNQNGMPARAYAESVVEQLLRKRKRDEIWEGKLAWILNLIVIFSPLWFLSVILEKAAEVTTDPRGVWLTGDAVRIFHAIGIGHEMNQVGHEPPHVNFHHSTFNTIPFYRMKITTSNSLEHEVPPTVEYLDSQKSRRVIRGQWLVGADGKTGIVRKHFLEPTAGIKQEAGVYPYEGVWVAANLKMTVPTPQTHPNFPLWKYGYTPDEVYDLFWPLGWHFCSPPGRPTATGRFGPHADRTWRHEFRVDEFGGPIYPEELFWEHISQSITLKEDPVRGHHFDEAVEYPRDCIEILRCRPFKFVHKCVNRWFDKRTLLIGDAAHVFPPFAGQGIASGVRDAHQLAWRLALLLRTDADPETNTAILESWAAERRHSVDDAARMSMVSGTVCNSQPTLWILALAKLHGFINSIPMLRGYDLVAQQERRGFCGVAGGFFLKAYNGGARLAQIHVRSSLSQSPILSDDLLRQCGTIFTVLLVANGDSTETSESYAEAKEAISGASLDPNVLSEESIVIYDPQGEESNTTSKLSKEEQSKWEFFSPVPTSEVEEPLAPGYNSTSYLARLGSSAKFVVLRPDMFVFACARSKNELAHCLDQLRERLG
ncbi:3-(3-hydroxy-phenyl)propionate/3-hydroxycinnamic acid hydroxylase [Colletotrichum sp. SAR 10_70]|nr:3-(3-hydroxy-phenyl)propionate/3-hydroxycinnamic acid hydroxylase [Colletotrichum sp. SAR 10_71]KAI8163231.1 3-(3-hydroxy-phenyl)propionate/3-hydroxycinnamic acid hydroxylase [Colletotrichum sp. SAR 10_70]KAI8202278.1 3-(3-hydroxy-phenyl)propionate/3-hydroxycinnamic acid hydroxylase [Colletotrichum sp. SAR 10_76]